MTTVNQSELQTAVSVDELLALGSNPALTDLLFYVRDGSQASENGKHRKVAGDVLRALLAPLLKTLNSESLFGSGNIAISAGASVWPALDSTLQTGNFNFGSSSRMVPISLAAGNIVGTLPASPADGQICGVVAQGISGGSANRFSFGLNGKTINGAGLSTETRTTGFESESSGQKTPTTSLVTQLGLTAFTQLNTDNNISSFNSRTGARSLHFYGDNAWVVSMTTPNLPNGGVFSYWSRATVSHAVEVNGATVATFASSGSSYIQRNISLGVGVNIVRFYSGTGDWLITDDYSLTGVPATAPSDWTDVTSRNVGPQGCAAVQWSEASQTWHVLFRRQLA